MTNIDSEFLIYLPEHKVTVSWVTRKGAREENQDYLGFAAFDGKTWMYYFPGEEPTLKEVDYEQPLAFVGIVADGVGGRKRGDEASRSVVKWLIEGITKWELSESDIIETIEYYLLDANNRLMKEIPESATTVAAIISIGQSTVAFHSGDSRVYVWSKDSIWRTQDHSMSEQMFRAGIISEEEMRNGSYSVSLLSCIGMNGNEGTITNVKNDWNCIQISSDGYHGGNLIKKVFESRNFTLETIVEKAISDGSKDNVTVLRIDRGNGEV